LQENVMAKWFVTLVVAMFAVGAVQVAAAQGQSQGKGQGKDGGKQASNHGQVVSECNHRANDRKLKGEDRKDFIEWCESRGARYHYDDKRYSVERNCYQKANNKGLTGDKRRNFLDKCLTGSDDKYYGGKVPARTKD